VNSKSDNEIPDKGKIIQEHLEAVNMDPWYYIYQAYVNPSKTNEKGKIP
jgi:hypothetical protein